ncbi:YaaR family protein [Paenibacillus lemnae]|uniref:YaaR family protein n=1 Tax=Paenibacillus lemnae TaxID=1330551 RepID=A0A848MCD5_PAELE|nr:YaaR family protein [Paenibacillus lemnae]NMO97723.1 YaaR family protein [Paenibacillus lemnae]
MKINPGFRPLKSELPVADNSTKPVQQKSFSDIMYKQGEQATSEELGRQMREIAMQGDRLARAMTIRELKAYRFMVKRFLEETVRRGVKMKETRGWDRRGRSKRYNVIDAIDSMLLSMADELLETEQGKIELLGKIGEIRGMLINMEF